MSSDNENQNHQMSDEVAPVIRTSPEWTRPAIRIFLIWAAMTAVGVVIGIMVPSHVLPGVMSSQMKSVKDTFVFFTVVAAPIAALVYAVATYSWHAWRVKGSGVSDTPPPDGPSIRGNNLVTSLWLGMSVVGVLIALIWGMAALAADTAPQTKAIQVNVTGQQWLWTFSYPGTGVTSQKLYVPEGYEIDFHVTSMDVTHGFWPVQLGVQIDANPNVKTLISASPNKLGMFDVRCSQLCGLYHAYMQTKGYVLTPTQFAGWLSANGASHSSVQSLALGAK